MRGEITKILITKRACKHPLFTEDQDYLKCYQDSAKFLMYVEKSALCLMTEYENEYKYSAILTILKEIVQLAVSLPDSMLIDGKFGARFFAPQANDGQGRNKIDSLCQTLNGNFGRYPTLSGSLKDIVELYRAILYIFNTSANECEKAYDFIRRAMAFCLDSDPTFFDVNLKNAIRLFLGVLHKVVDAAKNDNNKLLAIINVNLVSYFSFKLNLENFAAQSQQLSQKLFSLKSDAFLQVFRLTQSQAETLQTQAKALEALGFFMRPQSNDEEPSLKRPKSDSSPSLQGTQPG